MRYTHRAINRLKLLDQAFRDVQLAMTLALMGIFAHWVESSIGATVSLVLAGAFMWKGQNLRNRAIS